MQKKMGHRMVALAGRFLILMLAAGFLFSNFTMNVTNTSILKNGQADLENVIINLKSFAKIDSAKEASQGMRAMVISLQSASGLLVSRQAPGEEDSQVLAVFFKLPFLFASQDTLSSTLQSVELEDTTWINTYSSIHPTPPLPPPLFLC